MSEHVETLCKYCEAVLDIDYAHIGICPCCLDEDYRDIDKEEYCNDTYFDSEWDSKIEESY